MNKYLFLILILFLYSCENQNSSLKIIQGDAIGTTFSIRYLDEGNINFRPKIDSLIKAINKSTSTYLSNSDISKINKGDTTVVVDAYFEEVFTKSEKIYNETDGDFDKANQYLSQKLGLSGTQTFHGSNGFNFTGKDGIQYSWHHHQDGKTMVLVPFEIHKRTAHIGGAKILEKLKSDPSKGKGLFPDFKDIQKFLSKCI